MSVEQIKQFVVENVRRGYSLEQIRQHLLANKVMPEIVDQALKEVYLQQQKAVQAPIMQQEPVHKVHLSTFLMLIVILVVFSFSMYFMYSFFMEKSPYDEQPKLLFKTEVEFITDQAVAGSDFTFTLNLRNLDAGKTNKVAAEYRLKNAKTFKEIMTTKEDIVVEGINTNKEVKISIPAETEKGTYFLYVKSSYKGEEIEDSYIIKIGEAEALQCKEQCDDGYKCTKDVCDEATEWSCVHKAIVPCCGDSYCDAGETCPQDCIVSEPVTPVPKPEIQPEPDKPKPKPTNDQGKAQSIIKQLDYVKTLAYTDRQGAMKICADMEFVSGKDQCYLNIVGSIFDPVICDEITSDEIYDNCFSLIAQDTGDATYCDKATDATRKDSCLFTFVSRNDFSVCESITNPTRKNICFSLKDYYEGN